MQDSALNRFALSPSDNMRLMRHLQVFLQSATQLIYFSGKGWERNNYENDYLFLLIIILFQLVFQ